MFLLEERGNKVIEKIETLDLSKSLITLLFPSSNAIFFTVKINLIRQEGAVKFVIEITLKSENDVKVNITYYILIKKYIYYYFIKYLLNINLILFIIIYYYYFINYLLNINKNIYILYIFSTIIQYRIIYIINYYLLSLT